MTDDARQKIVERLRRLGIGLEAADDGTETTAPCPFCSKGDPDNSPVRINLTHNNFVCRACEEDGSIADYLEKAESGRELASVSVQQIDAEIVEDDFGEGALKKVKPVAEPPLVLERIVERNTPAQFFQPLRRKRGGGERMIISLLAVVFLGAGLVSASLSGFANFQAFSGSVADPLQARIWGWTGVIASVVSFGGFTFFYWHTANKRMKEGVRAALFALAGAVTSIIGTQMYIANNNLMAASEVEKAGSNRAVIELQIDDWRGQLAGIPDDTRSVEGLEAYLKGVEQAGRMHQKPYRDAQNELGLARRRDELEAKIEQANAQLLGVTKAGAGIVTNAPNRAPLPAWFFAIMLELFSSQGTSIGAVALLILSGKRP